MDNTHPHSHRLRLGRFSQAAQVYMVTVVTLNRRPIFDDFAAARTLVQTLKSASDLQRATTLAYVVMPDHLHWLMQLQEGAQLARCVRDVKSVTTHRLGHAVWQRGFHDHAVRREEDLQALARYVVANPVRAGLVSRTGLYPHWDAVWV
ncbi:MAG: transposase [Comamonadaceae bacterium PBBC2]|nr:MAG: transposase [Comamonadaceae bacterium PBBC2]